MRACFRLLAQHQQQQHQTPAMRQWSQLKKQIHPSHLLLFRVGDFFEAFHEDAEELSRVLNVQLTTRGSKNSSSSPVAMAGVPQHSVWSHVAKLLAAGRSVALADQTETPEEAARAGRRVVRREITRVVTPGTAVDDELLSGDSSAYLGAVAAANDDNTSFEAMWSDVASGNGGRKVCGSLDEAVALLVSMNVHEVLLCRGVESTSTATAFSERSVRVVTLPEQTSCEDAIRGYLQVSLSSSGAKSVSLGAERTMNRLNFDLGTRNALDLAQSCVRVFTSSSGHRMQPATQRLLRERVANPLNSSERVEIESRLAAVELLMNNRGLLRELEHTLSSAEMFGDCERSLQRLALGSVHRSLLSLARDIKSVALALKLCVQLSGKVTLERWNLANNFDWIEKMIVSVDTNEVLGIAKGADELLDKVGKKERKVREIKNNTIIQASRS